MFCGECGAKNKKTDTFCSECGAPLEQEVKKETGTTNKTVTPRQPMSKKNKIIIAIVAAVVIVLGIGYKVGDNLTSPRKIAEDYIKATINNDGEKLYKYIEIEGDTTFASKKVFADLMKDTKPTNEIVNYKITDVKYGDGKLSAKVTFKYTTKNSSSEKTDTVNLTKQKDNKYLIFANWKISDLSADNILVEDFTLKVPKGAKVSFAGINVTEKYLNKDETTSKLDVYKLPKVFAAETTIKVTLANGMEFEKKVTPSSYRDSYTLTFDEDNLSDASKEKLINRSKEVLTTVYTNAIAGKNFDEFKSNFEHKGVDLTKLGASYKEFLEDLQGSSRTLTSIEFTDMSIYDLSLNEDGNIEVEVRASFDYSIKYTSYSGEEKTDEDDDYKYITLTYAYDNNEYYLIDMDDLQYYFY